ncbi:unnamed protein product [Linum tenue]|uniref:Uncharacterized protein n=1 Tax=Linum tenue TaxID=586396 RepID=A0AAV0S1J5_9ROSI|nr:unnamed protein product [Linum tenue]
MAGSLELLRQTWVANP